MNSNHKRRQIKKEKIVDALKKANYSVQTWYIDTESNVCHFFHVRNNVNNLDMVCYIPQNIILISDTGEYVTKVAPTPDFTEVQSVWNECPQDALAVFIHNGIIIKRGFEQWEYYNISKDKPRTGDLEMIHQLSHEMSALKEDIVEVVSDKPRAAIEIVADDINPFDILIDGGDVNVEESKRVEDSQPSILLNYKGFTFGQAVPFVNIVEFMNNIKGYEFTLSENTTALLEFQALKIRKNGEEVVEILDKFSQSVRESLDDWENEWKTKSELLKRIQAILSQSSKKSFNMNDVPTRANTTLKQALEKLLERRDNLLQFLIHVKTLYGQT